jgi:hypothetical protein
MSDGGSEGEAEQRPQRPEGEAETKTEELLPPPPSGSLDLELGHAQLRILLRSPEHHHSTNWLVLFLQSSFSPSKLKSFNRAT